MSNPCLPKVVEQLKSDPENAKLSEVELNRTAAKILRDLAVETNRARQGLEHEFNPANDMAKARADALDAKELEILRRKKDAVVNAVVEKQFDQHLAKYTTKPAEGLKSYLDLTERSIITGQKTAVGRFAVDLQKLGQGVDDRFFKGLHDEDFVKELYNLNDARGTGESVTGNKEAFQIAKLATEHFDTIRALSNRAGGNTPQLSGFMGRNIHDQLAIRHAGAQKVGWARYIILPKAEKERISFETWMEKELPRLDQDRTFVGLGSEKERKDFMYHAWLGLASGEHLTDATVEGATFSGVGGSLSKKSAAHRSLHYTPEGFLAHNGEFGAGNMASVVLNTLQSGMRTARTMEWLGTNPENMFVKKIRELKAANDTLTLRDSLNDWAIRAQFDAVMGKLSVPVNPTLARIFQETRSFVDAPKLAFSALHSLPDASNAASILKLSSGNSFGDGIIAAARELVPGEKADKHLMESMIGVDNLMNELRTRTRPENAVPGWASKWLSFQMRANGQNFWDEAIDMAVGRRLSERLAEAPKSLAELNSQWGEMKQLLESHNINETRWALAKEHMIFDKTQTGRALLLPELARDIPEAEVTRAMRAEGLPISEMNIQKFRDALDRDFSDFISEQVSYGIPRQSARQMAISTMGQRTGTWVGETARTFWNFKGTALTTSTKILPRLWKSGDKVSSAVATARMVSTGMVLAGIGYTLSDWIKGKESRYNTEAWKQAPVRTGLDVIGKSGGYGIYGDFLTARYGKTGQSLGASFAGPVVSTLNDVLSIKSKLEDGQDISPATFKVLTDNAPYINIPVVRTALDYLILYHVQEALNPGYLGRMERYSDTQLHQKYMFPPSQNALGQ